MEITQPSLSNTGLFSPVFKCHLNTGPFANRTTFDHLNTRLVQFSDGYCIVLFNKYFISCGTLLIYFCAETVMPDD